MGDAAQRVLMNEFKQLSKEKWTNIEVRVCNHTPAFQWQPRAEGVPS
jgi:hypothetical protein